MDHPQQIIEAVTNELDADAEMQLHAEAFLRENLDADSPALAGLARQVQQSTLESRKRLGRWKWLLFALTMMAFLSQIVPAYKRIVDFQWDNGIPSWKQIPPITAATPKGNLLLHGDPQRSGKAQQMRALWESDLKNPAYFADYSLHYLDEHKSLPPDFLKTAREIDPDNAWFTCLAAAVLAKDCYKRVGDHPRAPVTSDRRGTLAQWSIIDPVNAAAAMDLWRQSLTQSRFTSYQKELWTERLASFPDPQDQKSAVAALIYLVAAPQDGMHFSSLARLLSAELQNVDTSTLAGQQLFLDVDRYVTKFTSIEPSSYIDGLIMFSALGGISSQILLVETSPLDPELVDRWKKRYAASKEYNEERKKKNHEWNEAQENVFAHGSMFAQVSLDTLTSWPHSPAISIEELAPMRYVEQGLILRFLSWFMMAALLIVLAILCADRFRHGSLLVQMGRVFAESIPMKTQLWFLFCGSILPFAYYLFLYTCTLLGGKLLAISDDGSIWVWPLRFPATPYVFAFLLMNAVPMLLALWITKNHSSCFVSSRSNGFYPIIAVLLTFIGWHLLTVNYTVAIWLAVPTLLWLLWSLIQGIFSKNPINILIRQVRVRLLIMSTCMAMIVFALASIAFVISERYWIGQDRLTNLPKDRLAASSYEAKVTESLYQKILEIRDRR